MLGMVALHPRHDGGGGADANADQLLKFIHICASEGSRANVAKLVSPDVSEPLQALRGRQEHLNDYISTLTKLELPAYINHKVCRDIMFYRLGSSRLSVHLWDSQSNDT